MRLLILLALICTFAVLQTERALRPEAEHKFFDAILYVVFTCMVILACSLVTQ